MHAFGQETPRYSRLHFLCDMQPENYETLQQGKWPNQIALHPVLRDIPTAGIMLPLVIHAIGILANNASMHWIVAYPFVLIYNYMAASADRAETAVFARLSTPPRKRYAFATPGAHDCRVRRLRIDDSTVVFYHQSEW